MEQRITERKLNIRYVRFAKSRIANLLPVATQDNYTKSVRVAM